MSEYSRELLQVIVAQICQSVGWESVNSNSLAVIVDLLHEYLRQLAYISHYCAELFGRTEMNLDDVVLAFKNMDIDLSQLAEYIENVGSIPCVIPVPKYPIPREDYLNCMKPGSRKVLKRPMYSKLEELEPVKKEIIFENDENVNTNQNGTSLPGSAVENQMNAVINNQVPDVIKRPGDPLFGSSALSKRAKLSDESKSMRKIHRVVMKASGCLLPACKGKLPESRTPFQGHSRYEEPEVSSFDERILMDRYENHKRKHVNSVSHKSTTVSRLKMFTDTKFFDPKDELTPLRTPEVPKTPKINISKVETLANPPEHRGKLLTENSVPMIFHIFPAMANGPRLTPYSIHSTPSRVPSLISILKKNQVCEVSKQPKSEVHSCMQNFLLPKLPVDNSGKYSTISYSSPVVNAPEELYNKKKVKNKDRRKKGKTPENSEKKKRRRKNKKKKEKKDYDDEVTIVNSFEVPTPGFKSSATKSVIEPAINEKKDIRSINDQSIRIRLPYIDFSAPNPTPENSNVVPVKKRKKRQKEDSVAKIKSSMKSLTSKCPTSKKVTFNVIPKKVNEPRSNLGLFPPTMNVVKKVINQVKKPVKKSSKTVKEKKQAKKNVPVITPVIIDQDGKKIWICPVCAKQDDGTPMIGCDDCDNWYHWICIGMRIPPPEDVNWYCRVCIDKKSANLET